MLLLLLLVLLEVAIWFQLWRGCFNHESPGQFRGPSRWDLRGQWAPVSVINRRISAGAWSGIGEAMQMSAQLESTPGCACACAHTARPLRTQTCRCQYWPDVISSPWRHQSSESPAFPLRPNQISFKFDAMKLSWESSCKWDSRFDYDAFRGRDEKPASRQLGCGRQWRALRQLCSN